MGLFHKTIQDMKGKIEHNDFKGAANIAKQHLADEHHFESDMAGLQRRISAFQEHLLWLSRMDEHFDKSVALDQVGTVEHDLDVIKEFLQKLLKEEKITLE